MQVLSHTFTYFFTQSPWTSRHLYRDTSLLIPSSYQAAACLFNQSTRYPTCTNFVVLVLQMFGDNFVHDCTRHFRTLFVHFANREMSFSRRVVCANVLYFPNNLRIMTNVMHRFVTYLSIYFCLHMFRAFFKPIFKGRCTNSAVVQVCWVWCQHPALTPYPADFTE
jgi:hypothetical protein